MNINPEILAELYDFNARDLIENPCCGNHNDTYIFKKMNENYILRISPSNDDYSTLKRNMEYLHKHYEAGSPVVQPIRSINDRLVEKVELTKELIHLVTVTKQKTGKTHDLIKGDTLNDNTYYELGRNLAILHNNSGRLKEKEFDFPAWNQVENNYNILNPESFDDQNIANKYKECKKKCLGILLTEHNYGIIHGDIHFSNIIIDYSDDSVTYCDFDDVCLGFYQMDMALLIFDLKVILQCENKPVVITEYINRMIRGYNDTTENEKVALEHMHDFLKLLEISLFIQYCELYNENQSGTDWISLFFKGRKERILSNVPYCAD